MIEELEDAACYLCGADDGAPWATENGYTAVKCRRCGLVYVTPRPALAGIDEAARTGEHRAERGSMNVTGRYHAARVKTLIAAVDELFAGELSAGRSLRWLDVGSGHGEMVVALEARLPARSTIRGVEPNEAKRRSALEHDVRLDGSLDDLDDGYDVVSLMNVYSHLPDPVAFLGALRDRLTPTGSVLLETGNGADLPNRDAYPDALYLPDHLSFIGERQLHDLADRVGFKVVATRRERLDTAVGAAKQVAKAVLRKPHRLGIPYTSPFRSLIVRLDRA